MWADFNSFLIRNLALFFGAALATALLAYFFGRIFQKWLSPLVAACWGSGLAVCAAWAVIGARVPL